MDNAYDYKQERQLALWFLLLALLALLAGSLPGVLQSLEHASLITVPSASLYYQGLSLHGILMALVWTSFFASAFLPIALSRSLGRALSLPALSWLALLLMVVGAGLMVVGIVIGPTILYTIDPPANNPLFYAGFLSLIVGTWLHSINHFVTWQAWKSANPGVRTPLAAFGTIATWILWDIATLGVLAELILMLINSPMLASHALLGRTLFWYFGNGLEYFSLLPAYISWLAMLPQQAGGKLYSERLARAVFILFLVFAIPSGLTHQMTDAGIDSTAKALHFGLAYVAAVPALITAFVTMASLEYAGKSRGAKGLISWVFRLPWGNPSFTAQVLALTALAAAGASSLVQSSFNMALITRGTTWEVGNLHLTLGTAGALTFMGISYWLLPYLTQRRLVSRALANLQALGWFFGALVFVRGMNAAGLLDAPRRTPFSLATYTSDLMRLTSGDPTGGFNIAMLFVAIGGLIMVLSGVAYFLVIAGTLAGKKETELIDVPLAEPLARPDSVSTAVSDGWRIWISAAVVLILLAYVPVLIDLMR